MASLAKGSTPSMATRPTRSGSEAPGPAAPAGRTNDGLHASQWPANERIEQLAGDDHGAIWIGAVADFSRVARSDLEAVAAGRSAQVPAVTFGPEEGLTGQVPVPNCQPDAWKDFRNRIWFCTQQGVIGIDANAVPPLPPPPVYIDRVSVDDREVDQAKIRVATGRHRLAFYFSSPNFTAPEKVRLRQPT